MVSEQETEENEGRGKTTEKREERDDKLQEEEQRKGMKKEN